MSDTTQLLKLKSDDLMGSDLLRLHAGAFGGDAALALNQLSAWLNASSSVDALTTVYSSPSATGFTVTLEAVSQWLILTPGAAYAAGTIVLPAGVDRTEILVNCTQAVTALTVTPSDGQSVIGAPTSLAANDSFRLRFDGVVKAWYRVG